MFSIIIPVYNGEESLNKCIESIQKQTYANYEIILVDDGSTDSSWTIAKELAKQENRLHCYHIDHQGTGATRNIGLSYALGDYILFLDVDDYYLDDSLLTKLSKKIEQNKTDVFMYQMVKVKENGEVLERYRKPLYYHDNIVLSLGDVYQDLVINGQVLASACNKCIRRELLLEKNIYFPEGVYAEDIAWVIHLFTYVETICLLNIVAYAYTQHRGLSRSAEKEAINDVVSVIKVWSNKLTNENVPHARAVAGFVAFEYGICMGNINDLTIENRKVMRDHEYLLKYGLDRKTKMIHSFYRIFGYNLTSKAIHFYLILRRIWETIRKKEEA